MPPDKQQLIELPGIGEYTATAIASIAFGRNELALDANVRRVVSRLFAIAQRLDTAHGRARLHDAADMHLPAGMAGDFNQALMDLGAAVCLPRDPRCVACPLASHCQARRQRAQHLYPKRSRKPPVPHRHLGAAVIRRHGRFLIVRRKPTGLLGGLWEFPTVEWETRVAARCGPDRRFAATLASQYGIKVVRARPLGTIRHTYSHFRVTVHALSCVSRSVRQERSFRWVRAGELKQYPMGRVDRQIANLLQTGARLS